jgi:hypothetical protein
VVIVDDGLVLCVAGIGRLALVSMIHISVRRFSFIYILEIMQIFADTHQSLE